MRSPGVGRLRGIWLGVRDLARSRAFYERLGAQFHDDRPAAGVLRATLGGTLLIIEGGPGNPDGAGPFLLFEVDDADALHLSLVEAGVEVTRPPGDEPWGRQFNVQDPDGHPIAFIEG